ALKERVEASIPFPPRYTRPLVGWGGRGGVRWEGGFLPRRWTTCRCRRVLALLCDETAIPAIDMCDTRSDLFGLDHKRLPRRRFGRFDRRIWRGMDPGANSDDHARQPHRNFRRSCSDFPGSP